MKIQMYDSTNDVFFRTKLPVEYDRHAACPKWNKYLYEVLPAEDVTTLQEWFGYNLVPDTSLEKFMLLIGEGANGKSVTLTVLKALLGEGNFPSVRLEQMAGNRTFPIAATDGKLANIASELSVSSVSDVETLKSYVTGEEMEVEQKYKDPFLMKPTARLTFSCNTLPHFNDNTGGLWRRLLVIEYGTVIPPAKRDSRMLQYDYWTDELSGILNWALEGYFRLKDQKQFTESNRSQEITTSHRRDCNFEGNFLLDHYVFNPEYKGENSLDIHDHYLLECKKFGKRPKTKGQFAKDVLRTFKNSAADSWSRTEKGKRARVWKGVKRV